MPEAWLVLASLDMMAWGVGQVFVKRATDRLGAVAMVLLVSVVDGIVYLGLFAIGAVRVAASPEVAVFAALSGVTGMLGYILYYEALLRGSVAVVGTISAGSPIITILGAVAFLREMPTPTQAVGVALLVAVVLILSYEPIGTEWKVPVAVALSIAILLLWGVWGIFTKLAFRDPAFTPFQLFLFYGATNFLMGPPYYALRRKKVPPPNPSQRTWATAMVGLLLLAFGIVATTVALSIGPATFVTAVSGCYPVVTALVAFAVLKEKVTFPRILAIAIFILGIVLVAF